MAVENLPHAVRYRPITCKIRSNENRGWAQTLCPHGRHGRAHAEGSRFVRSRANNRAVSLPCDYYRLSAQFGIVTLLDGSVEGIHVDVGDLAHADSASIICGRCGG